MSTKAKALLIALGLLTGVLLSLQFGMGLLIVRGNRGLPLPFAISVAQLIKAHHHSGYATVTIAMIYVLTSLPVLIRMPRQVNN